MTASSWPDLLEYAKQALPKVLLNRVLAEFEPIVQPVVVRPTNATDVLAAIECASPDSFAKLAAPRSRNAFLHAAVTHLSPIETHEELLIGFGHHRGNQTKVDVLWRGVGSGRSVAPSPQARHAMDQHVSVVKDGEVLLVHNHPPHLIKDLFKEWFGWRPLPSSDDRDYAARKNLEAFQRFLLTQNRSRFRWFLVDDGQLAEYFLPSIEQWAALLRSMRAASEGRR
jgi:hypothetical protein